MNDSGTRAGLSSISPFFIVHALTPSLDFYRAKLGFEVAHVSPDVDPFFAIVRRDGASLMLKQIAPEISPTPNPSRHPWASWDAFVHTPDPDVLSLEFEASGVTFAARLADTDDGLRGFSVRDHDGYTLFFGRPR